MNIPITCTVCGNDVDEMKYALHMQQVHPAGQLQSIAAQKNIPKTMANLPPGVNPGDLPSAEFLQTIKEMEEAKNAPPPPKPTVAQPTKPQTPSAQPIQLTYKYTGACENGHQVATLETDVENKHFAIAYCLQCNKQVESREVANLKKMELFGVKIETNEDVPEGLIIMKKNKILKSRKKKPSVLETPAQLGAKLSENSEGEQTEGPIIAKKNQK